MIINEKCIRLFHVVNAGLIPVEYEWTLGDDPRLAILPVKGRVGVGERAAVELCFCATSAQKLRSQSVTCKIVNGRSYSVQLSGTGYKPNLHLSWHSCDFGRVLAHGGDAEPCTRELALRNDDKQV